MRWIYRKPRVGKWTSGSGKRRRKKEGFAVSGFQLARTSRLNFPGLVRAFLRIHTRPKLDPSVFPAKAGIQNFLDSWIPARATPDYDPGLAGMTTPLLFMLSISNIAPKCADQLHPNC